MLAWQRGDQIETPRVGYGAVSVGKACSECRVNNFHLRGRSYPCGGEGGEGRGSGSRNRGQKGTRKERKKVQMEQKGKDEDGVG